MSDINTLRGHLFDTLKGLKDGTMDVEKAKAVAEVSQQLINTAKVEVDFIRANGGGQSEFFSDQTKQISHTETGVKVVNGATTVHRLK